MWSHRSGFFRIALLLLLASPVAARAQTPSLPENQIKAAFLYNFAKFTEWPGEAKEGFEGGFVLCITGNDPFGVAFEAIEGKPMRGQPFRVRRRVMLEELKGCHMLFVPESEERRMAAILKAASVHPVLTVGDVEGFALAGGMIELALTGSRMQFDINLAPANRANLKISPQLLKLARSVSGRKGGG